MTGAAKFWTAAAATFYTNLMDALMTARVVGGPEHAAAEVNPAMAACLRVSVGFFIFVKIFLILVVLGLAWKVRASGSHRAALIVTSCAAAFYGLAFLAGLVQMLAFPL